MIKLNKYLTKKEIYRVKTNIFSKSNFFISRVLIQIFFIPSMIYVWGIENFGIWSFLYSIPHSINLFNLNITEAAKTEMTINHYAKYKNNVTKIFNNALVYTILNLIILIIIMMLVYFNFDFSKLTVFSTLNKTEINNLIILSFIIILLNLSNGIFQCGITYKGKLNIHSNIEMVFGFLTSLTVIFVGFFTKYLEFAFISLCIISFFKIIINFYYYKKISDFHISLTYFNIKILKRIIFKSLSYYVENSSWMLKHNVSLFLIGIFFNAHIVGYIAAIKTFYYFLPNNFLNIFFSVFQFEYSNLFGKDNLKKLKKILFLKLKIISFLLIGYVFISLFLGNTIFQFWTNNSYLNDQFLIILIVVEFTIFHMSYTYTLPAKSSNNFLIYSSIDFLANIFVIILAFISFNFLYDIKIVFILFLIFNFLASIIKSYLMYKNFYLIK